MFVPFRYARLMAQVLKSNRARLDFPYKLNFDTTDKCNSRCLTCNIWLKPTDNELTTDEIRMFFAKSNRFSWIDMTGGEIFLRPDIVEVAEAILTNCKHLVLLHYPTNGLMPDLIERRTKEIIALKPPKLVITVSLDGPPELNDKIRGIPGDWKKATTTFMALKELGVEVFLGMTLSPYNYGKFREAFESVRVVYPKLKLDDFHLNIMHRSGHYYDNLNTPEPTIAKIVADLKEYGDLRGRSVSPFGFLERSYQQLVPKYLATGRSPVTCASLSSSCFLGPKGDIYPCSIWSKKLGNIRDYEFDLARIWQLQSTEEARQKVIEDKCPGCWTPCEAYQSVVANLSKIPSARRSADEMRKQIRPVSEATPAAPPTSEKLLV
ncbi:MAG: radical SAM protein [Verrucomicrobiae bacterium]|nr:radical SAM protein [Verrucomicrobiae bacterium]